MRCTFYIVLCKVMVILVAFHVATIVHADDAAEYNELLQSFNAQSDAGNYREAEAIAIKALKIAQASFQDQPIVIKGALINLANVYADQGKYGDAERVYEYALKFTEQALGRENEQYASCLMTFANLRRSQSRFEEAEKLATEGASIYLRILGPNHFLVGLCRSTLAKIFTEMGRYFDADTLYKQATEILVREKGEESNIVAELYRNRAILYQYQGHLQEAEAYCKRAAKITEKILGSLHPSLSGIYSNLGNAYRQQGRLAEAEKSYQRASMIAQKSLGEKHPTVADIACNLSNLYIAQQRYSEAESQIDQSLAIYEAAFGSNHPAAAETLFNLASLHYEQKQFDKALSVLDRILELNKQAAIPSSTSAYHLFLRGKVNWEKGLKDTALTDLRQALTLVEQSRGSVSGAEAERAQSFSQFNSMFETMVKWQLELGDTEEAFKTIERSRARSLLEEMNRAHVDLDASRTSEERARLRNREAQVRNQVAELERQFQVSTSSGQKPDANTARLRTALEQAREQLYDQHREELRTNPIYREMITRGTTQATFDDVRQKLLRPDDLLLLYLFGGEGGYVFVLTQDQARLIPLEIDEKAATTFATTAGPLTALRLQQILVGQKNEGIVPQLAQRPEKTDGTINAKLISQLESLFPILIPEQVREPLTSGKIKRMVIVPDGSLAMFPLEALIVRGGQNPEYLLDVGPSILYGPSASVLCNLADRSAIAPGVRPPVLTVADPVYPAEITNQKANQSSSDVGLIPNASRYSRLGGQLTRLPFTAVEASALVSAFSKVGTAMGQLKRELATEANVRFNASDRKIIHLACHGLTDQAYANFFGALALTPGVQGSSDPADDGFLTLPEIYELKLKGCELAILSACETNYGPQQQGEGTFALSRGFLVAGARRVVASNWLVDDEAAANLIGLFSEELAPTQKQSDVVDYAAQLQAAKKWVRQQNRWKSPYYWSSLVLIGSP